MSATKNRTRTSRSRIGPNPAFMLVPADDELRARIEVGELKTKVANRLLSRHVTKDRVAFLGRVVEWVEKADDDNIARIDAIIRERRSDK